MVGSGAAGKAQQGVSVALSADASTAIVGGFLDDALVSGAGAAWVFVAAGTPISGDANGDGSVTVADVFYLISSLFVGGPAPIGPADVNGDGSVTVADVFYLINYLFAGGPPPH